MTTDVRSADRSSVRRAVWRIRRDVATAWGRATPGRRGLPDVLVIGAQRAGTTSLHHYLAAHPRLQPPRQTKGVHWFDTNWSQPVAWYRAHFPRTNDGDRCFESSPYYLFHPDVPRRVVTTLPDVRVVAVLRDPVQRTWSHYHHEVARGFEQLSFEEARRAEADRLAGAEEALLADEFLVHHHHLHHAYLARSRYAEQVARWYDTLGRDRVLVLDTDDLRRDPQAVGDRVCDFLDLPAAPLEVGTIHNARSYPRIDDATAASLAASFRDDDRELVELTGQTFGWMSGD